MSDVIAVLNAGSSSLKFSLFGVDGDDLALLVRVQAESVFVAPRFVAMHHDGGNRVRTWVIPIAEELMIARHARRVLAGRASKEAA